MKRYINHIINHYYCSYMSVLTRKLAAALDGITIIFIAIIIRAVNTPSKPVHYFQLRALCPLTFIHDDMHNTYT